MRSKWEKILIGRMIEIVLIVASFIVGAWTTVKSSKLEDELDKRAEEEIPEDE